MKFLKFLFGFAVLLVLLAVVGKIFLFDIAQTNSYSMIPTLVAGDTFLFKTVGKIGPSDIVVCDNPEDPDVMVVLRVIALPGETIAFNKNHIIFDGDMVHHQVVEPLIYVDDTSGEGLEYAVKIAEEYTGGRLYEVALMDRASGKQFKEVSVPDGHFFLVGDNRNMARDSRNFGFVPTDSCYGSAMFMLWPGEDSGDLTRMDRLFNWL